MLSLVNHPIWYYNIFFYLFIVSIIIFGIIIFKISNIIKLKMSETKLMQQQHIARIDTIRKENSENLEKLRIEMLKREEERSRQWMESEKETLYVLKSVSNLLDLTDKIGQVDSEKIIKKLDDIQNNIENNYRV